jgi:hypothetical protein
MRKEMPVIPVNKVAGPKRIIGKRAEEEERHKGSLTKKKQARCGVGSSLRLDVLNLSNSRVDTRVARWFLFKPKIPIFVNFE